MDKNSKKKSKSLTVKSPRVKKTKNEMAAEEEEGELPDMPTDVKIIEMIASELPLGTVTVFRDRAELVRQLKVENMEAGYCVVRVSNVSVQLDEKSVRCEAALPVEDHDQSSTKKTAAEGGVESEQLQHQLMKDVIILEVEVRKATKERDQESGAVKLALREEKAATLELRKRKEQRQRLLDRKTFLTNYSQECTGKKEINLLSTSSLDGAVQFLDLFDKQREQIDDCLRAVDVEIEEAEEVLKSRREQLSTARVDAGETNRVSYSISVTLYCRPAAESKSVRLDLKYLLANAAWEPSYDCRVNSLSQTMQLNCLAKIVNATGEHFDNASLILSSAEPAVGGTAPELRTLRVTFKKAIEHRRKQSQHRNKFDASSAVNPMFSNLMQTNELGGGGGRRGMVGGLVAGDGGDDEESRSDKFGSESEDGLESESDDEINSRLGRQAPNPAEVVGVSAMTSNVHSKAAGIVNFRIPRKTTVKSGADPKKVTISICTLPVSFSHTIVPDKSESAFLRGTATNTLPYPFLAGDLNVFIDNSFLARSKIKKVQPGGRFSVFLGVDDSVVVTVQPEKKRQVTGGGFLSGKTNVILIDKAAEIHNSKEVSIMVNVFQQCPLSETEKIRVRIVEPSPSTIVKKSDLKAGSSAGETGEAAGPVAVLLNEFNNLRFSLVLEPGEYRLVKFAYQLEYPKDKNIEFE